MRHEVFRNFDFVSHYFLRLVGILLAATLAANFDFLGQHGKRSKRICLPEQDAVLIADVSLVVKAMILTDNSPEVVLHRVTSKFPNTWRKVCTSMSCWPPQGVKKLQSGNTEVTSA